MGEAVWSALPHFSAFASLCWVSSFWSLLGPSNGGRKERGPEKSYLPGPALNLLLLLLSRFSRVRLLATPWTAAYQAPLSMGLSRQEYWIGLPCPSPGALPDPGIEPASPVSSALQADSLPLSNLGSSVPL